MPKIKRSLYQCLHAKTNRVSVYCEKGHKLGGDGVIAMYRLAKGQPLEIGICQNCLDYVEIGPPLKAAERGWL